MKSWFKCSTVALLMGLLCVWATAHAASVYKVSKDGNSLFLAGTIHILTAQDYPLPEPYEVAFAEADKLIFETDLAAMNSVEFQQQVVPVMAQPPGRTLNHMLSEQTQQALQQFLDARGIQQNQIQPLTPAGATLVLTMVEYQIKGFTQEGVDQFYFGKATDAGKPVGWLESVESQVALLDSLNALDPNNLIEYTLNDLSKGDETIQALHSAWRDGDIEGLEQAGLIEWKQDYPGVYADFMTKRNNAWYPQIVDMINTEEVEYILVGALHLAGEDGLLHMLKQDGYIIEKL